MNTELLLKVKEAILDSPERFDMSEWYDGRLGWCSTSPGKILNDMTDPACGTVACLAGWCVAISETPVRTREEIEGAAWDALNIASDSQIPFNLFHATRWPSVFNSMLKVEKQPAAPVAALVIDRFISEYEAMDQ
jgi:hypothetical protein